MMAGTTNLKNVMTAIIIALIVIAFLVVNDDTLLQAALIFFVLGIIAFLFYRNPRSIL